jgi:hypothetical protein
LGVLVGGGGALDFARLRVPVVISPRALDTVLMKEADIEPNGRVERAVLMEAQPGEIAVEVFAVFAGGEIAVGGAPVGDRAGDAVDELAGAVLALGSAGLAVEILTDDDVGGQGAPGFGDLAIGLLEQDVAGLILDLGRPLLPGNGLEWVLIDRAKLSSRFHRRRTVASLTLSAAVQIIARIVADVTT